MRYAEMLPVEIESRHHAEQQLRGVVRVVMPQPALVHRVLQPGGKALHESIAGVTVERLRFLGKLVRFCHQQPARGDHRGIAQAPQVFFGESQQRLARVFDRGRQAGRGGFLVFGDHAAQQFLLAAEVRVQRLLRTARACGHGVHADAEALLGHELAHSVVDTAATLIERGSGGGLHAG